jgi:hypothetical protein
MNVEATNLFSSFVQEIATKGSELVVAVSKHTGIFVSFYDVGNAITNIFTALFK